MAEERDCISTGISTIFQPQGNFDIDEFKRQQNNNTSNMEI